MNVSEDRTYKTTGSLEKGTVTMATYQDRYGVYATSITLRDTTTYSRQFGGRPSSVTVTITAEEWEGLKKMMDSHFATAKKIQEISA